MDLLLWRHAEAIAEGSPADDLGRPLTPQGTRQAQRTADWLNPRLAQSARVLVSPALRCQQTANCLGRPFATVNALAPGSDVEALLQAARWPVATEPVLVVSHQPTLGLAAAFLLGRTLQPWAVKKGSVWWFSSRDREDPGEIVLQVMQSPDYL